MPPSRFFQQNRPIPDVEVLDVTSPYNRRATVALIVGHEKHLILESKKLLDQDSSYFRHPPDGLVFDDNGFITLSLARWKVDTVKDYIVFLHTRKLRFAAPEWGSVDEGPAMTLHRLTVRARLEANGGSYDPENYPITLALNLFIFAQRMGNHRVQNRIMDYLVRLDKECMILAGMESLPPERNEVSFLQTLADAYLDLTKYAMLRPFIRDLYLATRTEESFADFRIPFTLEQDTTVAPAWTVMRPSCYESQCQYHSHFTGDPVSPRRHWKGYRVETRNQALQEDDSIAEQRVFASDETATGGGLRPQALALIPRGEVPDADQTRQRRVRTGSKKMRADILAAQEQAIADREFAHRWKVNNQRRGKASKEEVQTFFEVEPESRDDGSEEVQRLDPGWWPK